VNAAFWKNEPPYVGCYIFQMRPRRIAENHFRHPPVYFFSRKKMAPLVVLLVITLS